MSGLGKRARELVSSYRQSLERRIDKGDSRLVCDDPELWKQAKALLTNGNGCEAHSLGLNPLEVMDKSLMRSQEATGGLFAGTEGERRCGRGGLKGLAKAFEILELATLNLYLSPWRKEYEVVKMYSGMFTHYIKPVLSMPQIEDLFGLLGYRSCQRQKEQLRLHGAGIDSMDNLLHLACAFFLARAECHLLLNALGRNQSQQDWEMYLVQERRKGLSVQAALENTKRKLVVTAQLREDQLEVSGSEGDLDLYTAEEGNEWKKLMEHDVVNGKLSAPPPVGVHSGEVASSPSSSTPESLCISTLTHQLAKTSMCSSGPRSILTTVGSSRGLVDDETERGIIVADLRSSSPTAQVNEYLKRDVSRSEDRLICSCISPHNILLQHCNNCNAVHSVTCHFLEDCNSKGHTIISDMADGGLKENSRSLREGSVSAPIPKQRKNRHDSYEAPRRSLEPITFHQCCDSTYPDPQFTCNTCRVFHSSSCEELLHCEKCHNVTKLGVCSCGIKCPRDPIVLCNSCGSECCVRCWYKNPVTCTTCGQTLDLKTSV